MYVVTGNHAPGVTTMNAATLNIHPADELAAVREEIKQLQDRESFLRASLIDAPADELEGRQYRAVVIASTRESIDRKAIEAALGRELIEPFLRATSVRTLKTVRKEDNDPVD
jgi:hypothetical protein